MTLALDLTNGARREFVQPGVCAASLRGQIRPDRFFAQTHLILSWPDSVTILPTERIERAELRASSLPDWRLRDGVASFTEITAAEYERIHQREPAPTPHIMGRPMPTVPDEIGIAAEMRSGAEHFLRL